MSAKGILILLFIWVLNNSLTAQVVDLSERVQTIEAPFVNEIELTTQFLFSNEYKIYLDNFTKTKNTRKFQRDYTIGKRDTFFVRNVLDQSSWIEYEATLVQLIDDYAIWIETNALSELSLDNKVGQIKQYLKNHLLYQTDPHSINPNIGIIEILKNYVGDFPNSDGDGVTDILYLDIIDEFESSGQFVAGFFDPINLSLHEFSNRRDMVYMDIYPTLIEDDTLNMKRSLSTLVHELQHLIHAGYEGNEPEKVFINEGFSEAVEILCGFPPRNPDAYLNDTSKPLLNWDYQNPISDYARASLWTHYLVEQFGYPILKDLIQNEAIGISGYDVSIRNMGGSGFQESFQNWGIANVINNFEISDKYGYRHPLLKNIQMHNFGVSRQIPNVISGSIPELSHSLFSIPYVENALFQMGKNHNQHIALTGLVTYPDSEYTAIKTLFQDNEPSITDINPFGSISVLLSNNAIEADSSSNQINILIDGEKSASERLIHFGDGVNDTFYSNASFLKLSGNEQKIGLILPKQDFNFWLKNITLSTVFDSELVGNSNLSNSDRDFLISVYEYQNSNIGNPFVEGIKIESKREPGKLIKESFSLEQHFSSLSNIEDSVAIIISNDLDDENYISIGLDFSESQNGILYNNEWQSFSEVNIGGNSLNGFTPNLSLDIVENGHHFENEQLIQSVEYNFEKVIVEVSNPIGLNEYDISLITKLPDGTFEKYQPTNSSAEVNSFEVPVQVDGDYLFRSVIQEVNASRTIIDEMQWSIDLPNGISINQNYPNPFNPSTSIPFTLVEQAKVGWNVFDILGRNVLEIVPTNRPSGEHVFELDLNNYASGVYFVRAVIERERTGKNFTQPIKVLMIK